MAVSLVLLCALTGLVAIWLWHERTVLLADLQTERAKHPTRANPSPLPFASSPSGGSATSQSPLPKVAEDTTSVRKTIADVLIEDSAESNDLIALKLVEESISRVGMLFRTVEPGTTGLLAKGVHAATTLAALRRLCTLAIAGDSQGIKELKDAQLVVFTTGDIKVVQRVEQYYEVRFLGGPMKGEAMWVHDYAVRHLKSP